LCGAGHSVINPKLLSGPLVERVRAELARYPASPHRLTYYFLLNHTRRAIGSWLGLFYLFGHIPALPYMYYPFLIQSLSLDPSFCLENWMQNECLKAMNPEAAAIPSTRTSVPAEYVIDLKREARESAQFASRHFKIRRDATRYLPGLKRSLTKFRASSLL